MPDFTVGNVQANADVVVTAAKGSGASLVTVSRTYADIRRLR